MQRSIRVVAALILLALPATALAQESGGQGRMTGTVTHIDRTNGTIKLEDQEVYKLPQEVSANRIRRGERVEIDFRTEGNERVVTRLELLGQPRAEDTADEDAIVPEHQAR